MNMVTQEQDNHLNTVMESWQVPPPSPNLAARIAAQIIAAQIQPRAALFPWSPVKLAAATLGAMAVGIVLGLAVPSSDAAADTTDVIEMLW